MSNSGISAEEHNAMIDFVMSVVEKKRWGDGRAELYQKLMIDNFDQAKNEFTQEDFIQAIFDQKFSEVEKNTRTI